jgi:hypothetical protein
MAKTYFEIPCKLQGNVAKNYTVESYIRFMCLSMMDTKKSLGKINSDFNIPGWMHMGMDTSIVQEYKNLMDPRSLEDIEQSKKRESF